MLSKNLTNPSVKETFMYNVDETAEQVRPNLHTKRLSIQSDIYPMSYWYN